MRRNRVGRHGLTLSELCLGTLGWGSDLDRDEVRDIVRAYVAGGGSAFDSAYGYGDGAAEHVLGELLGDVIARDEATLISKSGISRRTGHRVVDTSRGVLLDQLDATLRRLGTDHLDLWLVHTWDPQVPDEETLSALDDAVRTGRTRYVGVSNHNGWQLARTATLAQAARVPIVADEVELSLLRRAAEQETAAAAEHLGVGLLAWSTLGRGVLTGKYRHTVPADSRGAARPDLVQEYLDPHGRAVVEAVCTAADGLGVAPAQVALAWALQRPAVAAAVIGARTVAQCRTLVAATELVVPQQVSTALDDVSRGAGHSSSRST